MPKSSSEQVAAAVLAGGAGSRIGGDKALVRLGGKALIEYPLAALREAGFDPFVVTKAGRDGFGPDTVVVYESATPQHPLTGVVEALRHADGRKVLVVACDMPFLPPALLAWLAGREGDAVVPLVNRRPQPLAALYSPESLGRLESCLERECSMGEAIAEIGPNLIDEKQISKFGDPNETFFNVNTREDQKRAESLMVVKQGERDHESRRWSTGNPSQ